MQDALFLKAKGIFKKKTTDALPAKNRLIFAKEFTYDHLIRLSA